MTAIVGVLNKRAAVMAADSAITVTRGTKRKIYNTATKIFKLSEEYPVGVMLFSSADFMETPWDVIIKMYAKKRGHQCFDNLKGYVENFVDFLSTEPMFMDVEGTQHRYVQSEMAEYYRRVKEAAIERCQAEVEENPDKYEEDAELQALLKKHVLEVISEIKKLNVDAGSCPELEDYSFNDFCSYAMDDFRTLMAACKEDDIPVNTRLEWEKGIHCYLTHGAMYQGTGLVFVGYGEKETFPSLIPIYLSGIVDGRVRYCYSEDEEAFITHDNIAAIQPFAQCDVMTTMMKGIAPDLYELISDSYTESLDAAKQKMIEVALENGASEELVRKMRKTDVKCVKEEFDDKVSEFIQQEYVDGIIDAVDSFGIKDMANLAESLVSITNLQRHMTSSEESVGGPVDVAVITRSEGFVWIKHKS